MLRVVADRAGDDRNVDRFDDRGEHAELLVVGQRRRLTGRAAHDETVVALGDQVPRELLGDVVVDGTGGIERRDHRRHDSAEVRHQELSRGEDRTHLTTMVPVDRPNIATTNPFHSDTERRHA